MDQHLLIFLLLFFGFFLGLIALAQTFTKKISFPYTVALLLIGFVAQIVVHTFHFDLHLSLSPDLIYLVLLPVLLFEASMHINIHQFRLQFKTISFLSTVGLLISIFVIGFMMTFLAGIPFNIALLFGAVISATDPIAVLALFKTLGAPRRLSLLADGESMFNDATGVIAFKLVSAFVVAGSVFQTEHLLASFGDFLYVFVGSMIFGSIFGYIVAQLIDRVKEDRVVVAAITTAACFGSFVGAEHFFHFSGVISTVMAGIVLGNLGRTKIAYHVNHFLEEFWEYLGFIALSLVFFFAAYDMDLAIFAEEPLVLLIAVFSVLVARAVSVYVSAFITNKLPFFKDEPNMPMSWQHILNWGGLRGVIPLVLAYSLPETFVYRGEILAFTLASLVFTLIVNGLTIKSLLLKLKLHLPKREEKIVMDEEKIFAIEETLEKLAAIPKGEFSRDAIEQVARELKETEDNLKHHLLKLTTEEEFLQSLKLQALTIERDTVARFYREGYVNENVYYDFETELDLQQDALEHPEVFGVRTIEKDGQIHSAESYRYRLKRWTAIVRSFPILNSLLSEPDEAVMEERYALLRTRVATSEAVLEYLTRVEHIFSNKMGQKVIDEVRKTHLGFIEHNKARIAELEKNHVGLIKRYQHHVLKTSLNIDSMFTPGH